jgi:hypothetical protein
MTFLQAVHDSAKLSDDFSIIIERRAACLALKE